MRAAIGITLLLAGCSCASSTSAVDAGLDAGSDAGDAWSFHGCVWSAPPSVGVCDHVDRPECAAWAVGLVSGSDLEAYTVCALGDGGAFCASASAGLPDGGVACGDGPPCAEGSACARRPGEAMPSCVRCAP